MSVRLISEQEAQILISNGAGYFGDRVSIGNANVIVIEGKNGKFLAPRNHFVFSEFSVAPSKTLVNKIGGLLFD